MGSNMTPCGTSIEGQVMSTAASYQERVDLVNNTAVLA